MRLTVVALWLAAALLSGCTYDRSVRVGEVAVSSTAKGEKLRDEVPLLQLPPSALGKNMAAQQRLTVIVPGVPPRTLDVLLEVDAQSVRLAFLQLGQVVARLEWDGVSVQTSQSQWWPREVSAERILSDLQLVLWPLPAVQAALPAQWLLQAQGEQRVLLHAGDRVIEVRRSAPHTDEIDYVQAGWLLRIESLSLQESPAASLPQERP